MLFRKKSRYSLIDKKNAIINVLVLKMYNKVRISRNQKITGLDMNVEETRLPNHIFFTQGGQDQGRG